MPMAKIVKIKFQPKTIEKNYRRRGNNHADAERARDEKKEARQSSHAHVEAFFQVFVSGENARAIEKRHDRYA